MSEINGVMMQCFHWYYPSGGQLWNEIQQSAPSLADAGFTALWLPPAYKGYGGRDDVGYGVYDLFDLGEFHQRDTVATKYGTRQQYLDAVKALRGHGVQVYADAVLNHRLGGDAKETFKATPFHQRDRLNPIGDLQEIQSYTHFYFPGRVAQSAPAASSTPETANPVKALFQKLTGPPKKPAAAAEQAPPKPYSAFEWHWYHFDAVDYNAYRPDDRDTIYLVEDHAFDDYVALEKGNFAYLMGCDLDFQNEWVREEITYWGKWYLDTTGVDGFRLDAIKHIAAWFFPEWIDTLEKHVGRQLFVVGEYWVPNLDSLLWYIDAVGGRMSVFDVCLHYNFHYASRAGGSYDMRRLLDGTLMKHRPTHAVTFVENHDSQPLQALESPVEPWFKPLAYATILLRREGYPCIFYADYYGADYSDKGQDGNRYSIHMPSHRWLLDKFLYARKHYAYGDQYDYFDDDNVVGWTRLGSEAHPRTMAVIMSDGAAGSKWMEVGKPHTQFVDLTEHIAEPVQTNEHGWGAFRCRGGSVSVWVET